MVILVLENKLNLFNQISTLKKKKQTKGLRSIPVHIINLDQNPSHLFIQLYHAGALFNEILLIFK